MYNPRKKSCKILGLVCAGLLPFLGVTAQAQSTLTNGLQAYWSFDGNFLDAIAGFHGEARGTEPIPFVAGKAGFGQAIDLNGENQFVEITGGSDDDLEFPGGSMSISAWFKVDAFDTDWQALIAKGEGSNWRVARSAATSQMSYAGGIGDVTGFTEVNDGNWHHLVAITDATGAAFGTALYIDGVLDGTVEGTPVLAQNTSRVMIGENPEARSREWEGQLDDIAIWDRVLTEQEVTQLYAGGTGLAISSLLPPPVTPIVVSAFRQTLSELVIEVSDREGAVVDPNSLVLTVDGQPATTTSTTANGVTTFTFTPATAYTPGSQHAYTLEVKDTQGRTLRQEGNFSFPNPWFPREDLKGPAVVDNAWALRWIFGVGTVTTIPTVLTNIQAVGTPDFAGAFVDMTNSVINYGAGGFIGNNIDLPEEVTLHESGLWTGDDYILLAIGHVVIPEAGDYTFGVHSDDGFAFRIRGGTAVSVSGNGQLDPVDPEAVVHPADTGDSNTRAVFRLGAGIYRVEFVFWERGGGDFVEFYATRGAVVNDADIPASQWTLVGDPSPSQEFTSLGITDAGWSVVSSDPGGDQLLDWASAFADLDATAGAPTNYPVMNIGDPNTNAGTLPFPKDTSADDNDWALRATATLVVPAAGTYEIGFNSDDGAYVSLDGGTFTEIIQNGTGLSLIQDPETVICDCLTGDSATSARITLAAGSYPIEAGMFDRDGGGYLRVWAAEAGALQAPNLGTTSAGPYQTTEALRLTDDPPAPGGGGGDEIDLSVTRSGDNIVITWTGGGTLEFSPTLGAGATWTAVAGASSPATLPIGNANGFYRVRQ